MYYRGSKFLMHVVYKLACSVPPRGLYSHSWPMWNPFYDFNNVKILNRIRLT